MTEAVAASKPKSKAGKTLFAGVLVFVLLVAFAFAFYFLGGVDIVSGVYGTVSSWFAASTTAGPASAPPSRQPAAAVASPTVQTPSGLKLPPAIDESLARRMYGEQLESQANIVKLVTDEVGSFTLGKAVTKTDGTEIPLAVRFRDGTSAKGVLGMAKKADAWYLVYIGAVRDGRAAEGFAGDEGSSGARKLDIDVMNTVLEQQLLSQDVFNGFLDGTYTDVSVDGVTQGEGTATLEITLRGPRAAAMKGRVLCIGKTIDGRKTWFVTSFTKA